MSRLRISLTDRAGGSNPSSSAGGDYNSSYQSSHNKAAQLDRVHPNITIQVVALPNHLHPTYYEMIWNNLTTGRGAVIQKWTP